MLTLGELELSTRIASELLSTSGKVELEASNVEVIDSDSGFSYNLGL